MTNQVKYYDKNISVPEVLEKVSSLHGTIDDKAQLLSKYDGKALRWLVNVMYNVNLDNLTLPTEYKRNNAPFGFTNMSFASAIPKLEAALANRENLPVFNRHFMLVMENIHPTEADLILSVLSGKKIEGVSKAVFKRTYPQFFRESE